jgi:hypothetical protein
VIFVPPISSVVNSVLPSGAVGNPTQLSCEEIGNRSSPLPVRVRSTCHLAANPSRGAPKRIVRSIMNLAGESDERRFVPCKRDGREESPDSDRCDLARDGSDRATRLVTPGGCAS